MVALEEAPPQCSDFSNDLSLSEALTLYQSHKVSREQNQFIFLAQVLTNICRMQHNAVATQTKNHDIQQLCLIGGTGAVGGGEEG